MSKNPKLNSEGYYDLTTFYGIREADKQLDIKHFTKRNKVPRVYIVSPFAGDVETNIANARRYCRFALERGYNPIASHLYYTQFRGDDSPAERQTGLNLGIDLLRGCSEVWWFGDTVSKGMYAELCQAKAWRIPAKHYDTNCNEIK
jgi:hypothetical protein